MRKSSVEKIFSIFSALNPQPKTELNFTNTYTLLVAIVLSAQSTDVGVNKATKLLFEVADTPEKMLALGESGLKNYIKTIGLFNAKAANIIALSDILKDRHNSIVPDNFDALIQLPGVGVKTANVLLNAAFGRPTIAVDTHVFRVANRMGLSDSKTPERVGDDLLRVIPDKYKQHAHHWLILHGRYTCKARKPLCAECAVSAWCMNPVMV